MSGNSTTGRWRMGVDGFCSGLKNRFNRWLLRVFIGIIGVNLLVLLALEGHHRYQMRVERQVTADLETVATSFTDRSVELKRLQQEFYKLGGVAVAPVDLRKRTRQAVFTTARLLIDGDSRLKCIRLRMEALPKENRERCRPLEEGVQHWLDSSSPLPLACKELDRNLVKHGE